MNYFFNKKVIVLILSSLNLLAFLLSLQTKVTVLFKAVTLVVLGD